MKVAAPKGVVLGPLGFIENGISVDCLMHGRTGKAIMPAAEITGRVHSACDYT